MEDKIFSVSMINSRRGCSARSMITLTLQSDQLYDEEAAVDLTDAEGIEFHKKQMDITSLAVCKRDIYRIGTGSGASCKYA